MILTAKILKETGEALYGDDWEGTLARRLKVSRRTVNRWRDDRCDMPAGLYVILDALIEQQLAMIYATASFKRLRRA